MSAIRALISSIADNVKAHDKDYFVLRTAKSSLEGILRQPQGPLSNADVLAVNDLLSFISRTMARGEIGEGSRKLSSLEEELGSHEDEGVGEEEEGEMAPGRSHTITPSFTTPLPLEKKAKARTQGSTGSPPLIASPALSPAPTPAPAGPSTEPKPLNRVTGNSEPAIPARTEPSPLHTFLAGIASSPYPSPPIFHGAATADVVKDARENAILRGDVSVLWRRVSTLEQRVEEQTSRREIAEAELLKEKARAVAALAEMQEWRAKANSVDGTIKGFEARMDRLRQSMAQSSKDSSSAIEALRLQSALTESSLRQEAKQLAEQAKKEERTKVTGAIEHLQRQLEQESQQRRDEKRQAEEREAELLASADRVRLEVERERRKAQDLDRELRDRSNELALFRNEATNLRTKLNTVASSLAAREEELASTKAEAKKAKEALRSTQAELQASQSQLKAQQQQWSHSVASLQRALERAESHGAAEEALSRERQASVERLQREKAQLLASLGDAETLARDIRANHSKDKQEADRLEGELRPQLKAALEELALTKKSEKGLRESLETTRAALAETSAARDRLQGQLNDLEDQGQKERVAALSSQEALKRQASSLQAELSQLKSRLTSAFATADETTAALERESERLRKELREAHAKVAEARSEGAAKEASAEIVVADLRRLLETAHNERDAAHLRIEGLETRLNALSREKAEKEGKLGRLRAHLVEVETAASADRQSLQSLLEEKNEDMRRLIADLEETREDAATLSQRVVVLSSALTEEKERCHDEAERLQKASGHVASLLEERLAAGQKEQYELQTRMGVQQGMVEGLQSEVDSLRLSLQEEKALREMIARKLNDKDVALTAVTRERDQLQEAAADLSTASTTAVARITARAKAEEESLRRELAQLQERLHDAQRQAQSGSGSLSECHTRIQLLEKELFETRRQSKEANEARDELTGHVTRLLQAKEALVQRLQRLNEELLRLQHRTDSNAALMLSFSAAGGSATSTPIATPSFIRGAVSPPRSPPSLASARVAPAPASTATPTRPPPPPVLSSGAPTLTAREFLMRHYPSVVAAASAPIVPTPGLVLASRSSAAATSGGRSPLGFESRFSSSVAGGSQGDQLGAHLHRQR